MSVNGSGMMTLLSHKRISWQSGTTALTIGGSYILNLICFRTGSNRANGYIFMYVHQPLWEECEKRRNNDEGSSVTS